MTVYKVGRGLYFVFHFNAISAFIQYEKRNGEGSISNQPPDCGTNGDARGATRMYCYDSLLWESKKQWSIGENSYQTAGEEMDAKLYKYNTKKPL